MRKIQLLDDVNVKTNKYCTSHYIFCLSPFTCLSLITDYSRYKLGLHPSNVLYPPCAAAEVHLRLFVNFTKSEILKMKEDAEKGDIDPVYTDHVEVVYVPAQVLFLGKHLHPTRRQFESRLLTARSKPAWGGGGGVLSSNFVHQMCHQGGGGGGGSLVPTLSTRCATRGGEGGGGGGGSKARFCPKFWQAISP